MIKSARSYESYSSLQTALPAVPYDTTTDVHVASGDQFDFFGLPRELRNIVYDEILIGPQVAIPHYCEELIVKAYNAPRLRHLLVNRRFRAEILEQTRACTKLTLQDSVPLNYTDICLPSGLSAAHLTLDLRLGTPGLRPSVKDTCEARDILLAPFRAQSVPFDLELHVDGNKDIDEYLLSIADNLDSIIGGNLRELLTRFEVYRITRYYRATDRARVQVSNLVASYSHDTDGSGIFRRVNKFAGH